MTYQPTAIPSGGGFGGWLAAQLRQIADALAAPQVTSIQLATLAAPPTRYKDGMVVYANGVDWNPGSGAGVYARVSGAWARLN